MTSLRGRLDQGILMKADIEFFKQNKGSVPLCCCEIRFREPLTYLKLKEPLFKCDQCAVRLPMSTFRPFCLKCQEYIEKKLKEGVKTID